MKFNGISLSDKKYFDLFIGKRVLKKDIRGNEENINIPLYSANVLIAFGYVEKSNILDYNDDFVLWGIDGEFNFNYIKKGNEFATTDHCGVIRIKDKRILPEYLVYTLFRNKSKHDYDRSLRSSLKNMNKIKIDIPIKKDGSFDLEKQKEIAKRFNLLTDIKTELFNVKSKFLNKVTFDNEFRYKEISIFDKNYFKLERGKRITKTTINKHKGKIPVYSSSKDKDNVLGYIDGDFLIQNNLILYTNPSLLFNLDGSVGYSFVRRENRYSFIDVVAGLTPLDKKIDFDYLKYELENELLQSGATYSTKLYFGKIKRYDIKLKIPIKKDGSFDLEKQKEIAKKTIEINNIKSNLINKIDENSKLCSNIDLLD